MKKKNLNSLTLNKEKIANLNSRAKEKVVGGNPIIITTIRIVISVLTTIDTGDGSVGDCGGSIYYNC